jgi:hypothetical protein
VTRGRQCAAMPINRRRERTIPMQKGSKRHLAVLAALALLALPLSALAPDAGAQAISAEQVAAIIASPDRTAADRTNDLRRKPLAMLPFFGIQPGITAVDLSAAGGYTTELVARAVGPSGVVFGQSRPPPGASAPPASPLPPSPRWCARSRTRSRPNWPTPRSTW